MVCSLHMFHVWWSEVSNISFIVLKMCPMNWKPMWSPDQLDINIGRHRQHCGFDLPECVNFRNFGQRFTMMSSIIKVKIVLKYRICSENRMRNEWDKRFILKRTINGKMKTDWIWRQLECKEHIRQQKTTNEKDIFNPNMACNKCATYVYILP